MSQDAFTSLIWLAATFGIARSVYRMVRRAFPSDSATQLTLHTTVSLIAALILGATILGSAGLITRASLVLGSVALGVFAIQLRFLPSSANQDDAEQSAGRFLWVCVAPVLLGHVVVDGLMQFPDDYDCLMYHLPFIDQWLQTGSLAATRVARWSDPANSELIGLWFASAVSGDFLVALNNAPVLVVWATGLLELGRLFGLTGWLRHGAAVACLAVHTTVHETDDASNDLMVAAFFVAGIAYALRYRRSSAASDLALCGTSLGVLVGTKFLAIGYAAILGSLLALVTLQAFGWRRMFVASGVAVVVALPFGGYWYARNALLTGYPLFPQGSPALRERIVHPDVSKTTLAFNGDSALPELALDAVWRMAGPLQYLGIILSPVLLAGLVLTAAGHFSSSQKGAPWVLLFLLLATAAITLVTPMLVEDQPGTLNHLRWGYTPVRYSLSFLCVVVASMALLIQQISRTLPLWLHNPLAFFFAAFATGQFVYRFWTHREIDLPLVILVGVGLFLVSCCIVWAFWHVPRGEWIAIAAAVVMVTISMDLLSKRWHAGYASHFNRFYGTQLFNEFNDGMAHKVLVLDERPYAFFGSWRQNTVLQPPVYRSVDSVKALMMASDIAVVATRIDVNKIISRYRPAWDDLGKAREFRLLHKGRQLRVFEFHPKMVDSHNDAAQQVL